MERKKKTRRKTNKKIKGKTYESQNDHGETPWERAV